MDKIFIKNYFQSSTEILESILNTKKSNEEVRIKLEFKLGMYCILLGGLLGFLGLFITITLSTTSLTFSTFFDCIFTGLVGASIGILAGIMAGSRTVSNRILKHLYQKEKEVEFLLLKMLETEDFQKEILSHLNQLENSLYLSNEHTSFLIKLKIDLISAFYDKNYTEAQYIIIENINTLNNIQVEVNNYDNKQLKVNAYLQDKKEISEEKSNKSLILAKSFGSVNYDYRNQV